MTLPRICIYFITHQHLTFKYVKTAKIKQVIFDASLSRSQQLLGWPTLAIALKKEHLFVFFVKCFGKSKKDYNTICRFNDGSSCGNNPSISYLKTVSIKDPELRAVEIPRDRERRPLICSATTLVEILLIWLWLMMRLTHLLNHIKNEVPQGPGEMKRLSVRMES